MRRGPVLSRLVLLALTLLCSSACGRLPFGLSPLSPLSPLPVDTSPVVTPSPTVLPSSPTSIPTLFPAPTWTPAPTPTSPPTPVFPPEAVFLQDWPPIPVDLYFIRDGSLWRWAREGGLEQVVAASAQGGVSSGKLAREVIGPPPEGIISYTLSRDGRYVACVFSNAGAVEARVLDRSTGEFFRIPLWGQGPYPLSISPDGRYLVYLAWDVRPTAGSKPPGWSRVSLSPHPGGPREGTIFAVEVRNPNHQFELGYCAARSECGAELYCMGFALSTDGKNIAFADGRGLWLSSVPQGAPRLILENHPCDSFCAAWDVQEWSPDGKYVLLLRRCYEGGYYAVLNVDTGVVQDVPNTFFYPEAGSVTWLHDSSGLLVNYVSTSRNILSLVSVTDPLQETVLLSADWPAEVWATDVHEVPPERIGFANHRCVDGTGKRPGIYTMNKDGTGLEWVSPLPALACSDPWGYNSVPWGMVLWAPDGSAYLYLADSYSPLLLGRTDGSALWDVRGLLAGAYAFHWQP